MFMIYLSSTRVAPAGGEITYLLCSLRSGHSRRCREDELVYNLKVSKFLRQVPSPRCQPLLLLLLATIIKKRNLAKFLPLSHSLFCFLEKSSAIIHLENGRLSLAETLTGGEEKRRRRKKKVKKWLRGTRERERRKN
jgi:hypothetical protein